jgi:glucosylceramidase
MRIMARSYQGFGRSTVRGMVTVNQQTGELTYNLDYYALAHFSKFTQTNAIRIDSSKAEGNFTSVAFLNPDQTIMSCGLQYF